MSDKVLFGGNETLLKKRIAALDAIGSEYILTKNGAMTIIDDGITKKKYTTKPITTEGAKIMQCCKEVKRDALKFLELNPDIESRTGAYEITGTNLAFIGEWSKKNKDNDEIALVDLNHAYFRVAYLFGIVSEKTYLKWKDNRDARLIALGSFNRSAVSDLKKGDKVMETVKVENDLTPVWNYIVFKTYKAVISVCMQLNHQYFQFQTDGIYLPVELADKAMLMFDKFDLPSKKEIVKNKFNLKK